MNVSDSELVETLLVDQGFQKVDNPDKSDILFVNTCSIREHAEDKVHSLLGRYNLLKRKKPSMIIGVLGCMAQSLKDDILENKPYVDIVLGPDSYRRLPEILKRHEKDEESLVDTQLSKYEVYDDLFPRRKDGVNAWVTIMRGCDKFCTFCIVPFTRGRERSRSVDGIVREVKKAINNGFSEITLLGQNVNSYNYNDRNFPELLDEVAKVDGVKRIRYTSPHPQDINEELLDIMAKHDNICNYIHLPLQAGSNRILKRMNRTYTKEKFIELAEKIRTYLPGVGISTDIIVGFPGENENEFIKTYNFIKSLDLSYLHVFTYSERDNTDAITYDGIVSKQIRSKRSKLLRSLSVNLKRKFYKSQVGKTIEVLFETENRNGYVYGFSRNYVRVKSPWRKSLTDQIVPFQLKEIDIDGLVVGEISKTKVTV